MPLSTYPTSGKSGVTVHLMVMLKSEETVTRTVETRCPTYPWRIPCWFLPTPRQPQLLVWVFIAFLNLLLCLLPSLCVLNNVSVYLLRNKPHIPPFCICSPVLQLPTASEIHPSGQMANDGGRRGSFSGLTRDSVKHHHLFVQPDIHGD